MSQESTRHLSSISAVLALVAFDAAFLAGSVSAVTIPTVAIGNLGNASDQLYTNNNPNNLLFGAVDYGYRIGTTEVTNAQYTEFLNFKAASDPLSLYSDNMSSNGHGGITRSGSSGSYTYATKPGMQNKPVNFVSWYDTIRFTNWLHNGQGAGDTETGAYTLLGGTPTPSNGSSITRNPGAQWWLPSENEWYKAAYYDPSLNSGAGGYWDFPTQSNIAPLHQAPPGGSNSANFANAVGTVTDAGAYLNSLSAYGTLDQGGNLWEWNETLIGSNRGLRGGSLVNGFADALQSNFRNYSNFIFPPHEDFNVGFRVATVPEPSTLALAAFGALALQLARRRTLRSRTCDSPDRTSPANFNRRN